MLVSAGALGDDDVGITSVGVVSVLDVVDDSVSVDVGIVDVSSVEDDVEVDGVGVVVPSAVECTSVDVGSGFMGTIDPPKIFWPAAADNSSDREYASSGRWMTRMVCGKLSRRSAQCKVRGGNGG